MERELLQKSFAKISFTSYLTNSIGVFLQQRGKAMLLEMTFHLVLNQFCVVKRSIEENFLNAVNYTVSCIVDSIKGMYHRKVV